MGSRLTISPPGGVTKERDGRTAADGRRRRPMSRFIAGASDPGEGGRGMAGEARGKVATDPGSWSTGQWVKQMRRSRTGA